MAKTETRRAEIFPAMVRASYEASLDTETNNYPMVAQVTVCFNDNYMEEDRNIALLPMNELEGRVDDDEILFYVNGIDELADLAKPDNGEDFVITDILGYDHYPEED